MNGRPQRRIAVAKQRNFALLRPVADHASHEQVRDLVLHGYAEHAVTTIRGAFVVNHRSWQEGHEPWVQTNF